jgi:hypothetical protein
MVYIWHSTGSGGQLKPGKLLALLGLFYGAFWLFGPWVVDRLGRLVGRFARSPATLLAGRRLTDDPRGAWRTVSGLVLAGFAAGFLSVSMLGMDGSQYRGQVAVAAAHTSDTLREAAEAKMLLQRAGITGTVTTGNGDDFDSLLAGNPGIIAHVAGGPEQIDSAVTALTPVGSGRLPYTQDNASAEDSTAIDRFGEVSTATLALSFVIAAASAGLTAAADVLDRRRVYRLLRLAGTPVKVLDRARTRETVLPLAVLAGGTTALGVYGSYRLNKAVGAAFNTSGAVHLAVCAAVGASVMVCAVGGSRPLLRRATADAAQTAD